MGSSQSCCANRGIDNRRCCNEYKPEMPEMCSGPRENDRRVHRAGSKSYGSKGDINDHGSSTRSVDTSSFWNSSRNAVDEKKSGKHIRPAFSRSTSDNSIGPRRGFGENSWIQAPDPLQGWTAEEQQVVIGIMKDHPKADRDSAQLELVVVKGMRSLKKTEAQIVQCFQHIRQHHVAYFGGIGAKGSSINMKNGLRRGSPRTSRLSST
jgi:hypothetical protein